MKFSFCLAATFLFVLSLTVVHGSTESSYEGLTAAQSSVRELHLADAEKCEADASVARDNGDSILAATCYATAAIHYAVVGDTDKARELNIASAQQYEADVTRSIAQNDYARAVCHCGLAADLYTVVGDDTSAREIQRVEAKLSEIVGDDARGIHDHAQAAKCYRMAANLYIILQDAVMAHMMSLAAAEQLQLAADHAVTLGKNGLAEEYLFVASSLRTSADALDKAYKINSVIGESGDEDLQVSLDDEDMQD